MINTYRMITDRKRILICFIACLALALSSSCAQKKSAIEKLIIQGPSDETKRKVEEEKIRQSEAKRIVEVTRQIGEDVSPTKVGKDLPQEEKPQGESRVAVLQKKEIKEQNSGEALDSISKAISKVQKKPQKIPQPPVPKNIQIEKEVSLNFESTDIKDIIITFCELLKIDYILDPGISGKITLQTFKKAKVKDLFKILEKILILNNLTVIKTGNFYRFMPIKSAKKESLNIFFGKDGDLIPSRDRLIIQIIPLKYISTNSVKSIITPILSQHASFLDVRGTNNLVIIDTASNVKSVLEIINILDVSVLDKIQVKFFQVEHAEADEIADTLTEIFGSLGYISQGTASDLKFVPIVRLNSLLIINPFAELLPNIEFWISKLDKPSMEGLEEKTFVYYVQNTKATDLASLLATLYQTDTLTSSRKARDRKFRTSKKEPKKIKTAIRKKRVKPKPRKPSVRVKTIQSEEVSGKILFVADEFTNALIIKTLPRNYPAILETIKHLDLMPLQVMIEVLVLELVMDAQTRAGLDWAFKKGDITIGSAPSSTSLSFDGPSVGAILGESATALLSQGFSLVTQSHNFTALFQAFAKDSKLNVLSNPILITSENKPASISITNDIPIETTTIITPTAGQPLIQTSIQYKSVGIKLNITPHINRDRFVTLEISQESSNINEAAAFSQPAFFTRSTKTTVVVKDRQTLVIGGLMETNKSYTETGIPFLKDIPILGRLFRAKSESIRKTELIIFITPYVIANVSEANEATKSFRAKLLNIKKDFKLEKIKN